MFVSYTSYDIVKLKAKIESEPQVLTYAFRRSSFDIALTAKYGMNYDRIPRYEFRRIVRYYTTLHESRQGYIITRNSL